MAGQVRLKQSLGLWSVVLFGLAYMAPMIVLGTFGPLADVSRGTAAMAYSLGAVGITLTAISYGIMARVYPVAGSAYTYARKSISANVGFLVGWAMLLDYFFIPMVIWLIGASFLATAFPELPIALWITLFVLVTSAINIVGIVFASRINFILMVLQVAVLLAFIFLAGRYVVALEGPGGLLSLKPFFGDGVPLSASVAGAALAAYAFLGFDAVSTLTEETIDAKRTMPKAVIIVALSGGVIFILSAYLTQLAHPGFAFQDVDTAAFEIAKTIASDLFATIFLFTLVITQFAAGIAAQASVGRFLFAMGRDGVLPTGLFGQLHQKFHTPIYNLLLVGAAGFIGIFLDVTTSTSFINFGAFMAFTAVNLSVISLYRRQHPEVRCLGFWRGLLIPAIGALFDFFMLFNLDRNAQILGVLWLLFGLLYLTYLTGLFKKAPPEMIFADESAELSEA
jgi:amino acid transporter